MIRSIGVLALVLFAACSSSPPVDAPTPLEVAPGASAARPATTSTTSTTSTTASTPSTSSTPSTPTTSTAAATPSAKPGDTGVRAYAPVDLTCKVDSDCDFAPTLNTSSPSSVGCCVVCNQYTIGNRTWASAAKAVCTAAGPCNLPSSCLAPSVPDVHPTCERGRCIDAKK